jgi:histidine ammonia-lyase
LLIRALAAIRAAVPAIAEDRYLANDLERAGRLVAEGALLDVLADVAPALESRR